MGEELVQLDKARRILLQVQGFEWLLQVLQTRASKKQGFLFVGCCSRGLYYGQFYTTLLIENCKSQVLLSRFYGISCAGLQRFLIAVSCLKLKRHDEGSKLVLRSRKILVASLLCSPGVHFFLLYFGSPS